MLVIYIHCVSDGQHMRRYWNARAKENALFFIDNRLDYLHTDEARFWAGGETDLADLLRVAGATLRPGEVVLEIGCGVGRLTRPAAALAREVIALDVSDEMLLRGRECNAHLTNVRWVRGNGLDLAPVADASVDACFSHVVLQHIPDPQITLGYVREVGRVLRPGGWAALGLSNRAPVHAAARGARRRLAALLGRSPRGQRDPAWVGSAVELDDLRRSAIDAGLAVEQIAYPGAQYCVARLRRGGPVQRPDAIMPPP